MRKIKFKAYIEMENKIKDVCTMDFDEETIGVLEINLMGQPFIKIWDLDQVKLMQYTGLRDKNGVEIYEGDNIHAEGNYPGKGWYDTGEHDYNFNGVVTWEQEDLAWKCEGYYLNELDCIKIIGNIFENPELIEI